MPRRIEFPGYKKRMEEVRRELDASGTTQLELAAKADLPHWQVWRLLNGSLPENVEHLRRFADAVGKPVGWFLLDKDEIEALIAFHGPGPSRGKEPRRQGRRPLASLLLALGLGGASVLWPSGGASAEPLTMRYDNPETGRNHFVFSTLRAVAWQTLRRVMSLDLHLYPVAA